MAAKRHILSCLFLSIFFVSKAQFPIVGVDACSFEIVHANDTIQFLKVGDIEEVKPILIFCQGSLPIPLVIEFSGGERMVTGISNFGYEKLLDKYHIIVVSAPFIPLIANESHLNNQYAYITDKENNHSYPPKYTDNNYRGKYVDRLELVIDYLNKQKWVDKENMIVIGHSQGAGIAAELASRNSSIKALGFLSGNPLGRITQFIWEVKVAALKGEITQEKKKERLAEIYDFWRLSNEIINQPSKRGEDSPRNIVGFSASVVNKLTQLTIPVFIGYGTEDPAAWYCDFLPIEFIHSKKKNYLIKPYIGLNHNFMKLDSLGRSITDTCHWDEVMNDCIDFINGCK